MSFDTAEPAIADPPSELSVPPRSAALAAAGVSPDGSLYPQVARRSIGLRGHAEADVGRRTAMRDVWLALWGSRLIVWVAGIGAVTTLGSVRARHAFDPPGITRGLGWLGDLLASPVAHWDAAWYLVIAHYGYRPDLGAFTASRTAFFPLYPLGVRLLADIGAPLVLAGVMLSLGALALGLYGLHRLTSLEAARLDRGYPSGAGDRETRSGAIGHGKRLRAERVARVTVLLTALAPMGFYFSAAYSESLYLALSVGAFLNARRGRWAVAATLAALASATRSTGVVLVLPLALLYMYGPREDRAPDHPALDHSAPRDPAAPSRVATLLRSLRPRYRVRVNVLWLGLVPAGLCAYMAHLALVGGDALAPFHAEAVWSRHFAGPYGGVWDGTKAAFEGLRQLLSFQRHHVYYPAAGGSPFIDAGHNLLLFVFLLAAIAGIVGVLRMLPPAYGLYVLAALALPLSYPVAPQPLMSLPRFLVVLFPLNMWLAVRLASRPPALTRAALAVSGVTMAFFVGEFATWHWVA